VKEGRASPLSVRLGQRRGGHDQRTSPLRTGALAREPGFASAGASDPDVGSLLLVEVVSVEFGERRWRNRLPAGSNRATGTSWALRFDRRYRIVICSSKSMMLTELQNLEICGCAKGRRSTL
jgi:hypothetical protein